MQHVSEVAHILRAALNDDLDNVHAYAELLITKLHEDGEDRQANILHTVLYPSLEDVGGRIMPTGMRGSDVGIPLFQPCDCTPNYECIRPRPCGSDR